MQLVEIELLRHMSERISGLEGEVRQLGQSLVRPVTNGPPGRAFCAEYAVRKRKGRVSTPTSDR